jgi:hypothetical protein
MTEQTQTPQISMQDLASVVKVIDLASSRGAVRGEEMAAIGTLRTKIAEFLDHAQEQMAQAEGEPQAAPAPEVEDIPAEDV